MRPLGIVKIDPVADDPFGFEAIRQLVQIDRLVFERAPQPLDEDVVHAAAPAVHRDGDRRRLEHTGEVEAGELAAPRLRGGRLWSVLKISGFPYLASASFSASMQNRTSMVFDNRQART